MPAHPAKIPNGGGFLDFVFGELFGSFEFGGGFDVQELLAPRRERPVRASVLASPPPPLESEPVSILDTILGGAKTVGQSVLRAVIPDEFEILADFFIPDVAQQVLGPRRVFNIPPIFGPQPRTAATPPFFEFPSDINAPGRGTFEGLVIPEAPGIFDDLVRGVIDIIPELIPGFPEIDVAPEGVFDDEVTFEQVGEEFPQIFEPFEEPPLGGSPTVEDFPIEGFGVVQEDLDVAEGDINGVCPPRQRLPACITVAQWTALGRPEGYMMDRGGFLRKRRSRRKRPLSQQAKDDLAWAKATFGAGKAFDNVVARMRM